MSEVLIFGHKNPDTDSICSSLVMEKYGKNNGCDVEAVRLGEINKETKYVLEYLGIEPQRKIERIEDGQRVLLVDHNEFNQSVENIENAKICRVIDHHRICNFQTKDPIYYTAEPVGCTATIIYKMFKQANMEIEKKEAILLLSAIVSDTLLFKSPTCTEEDEKIARHLAEIAGIDIEKYGLDMLKAGTDLSDLSARQLITLDAKELMLKDVKAQIAQVNTANIDEVLERKLEIEEELNKEIADKNLDLFMFVITDIINSNSETITIGKRSDLVEKSYNVKLEDNTAFLPGIVSRKKQIVPVLTENA